VTLLVFSFLEFPDPCPDHGWTASVASGDVSNASAKAPLRKDLVRVNVITLKPE